MKKNYWLGIGLVVVALGYGHWKQQEPTASGQTEVAADRKRAADGDEVLQRAFANRQSNVQVSGTGTVWKTLPDDNQGSRHQRFILKLAGGQTLLVAHNIDLAPKLKGLKKGDTVGFNGEYEWNDRGGVIHWTHHDPAKRHIDGWLEYQGRRYQ